MKLRIFIRLLLPVSVIFCLVSCTRDNITLHGDITGTVTDATTSLPLEGATVILNQVNDTVITSNDGKFSFTSLTPGSYEISVSKQFYARKTNNVTVKAADVSETGFALDPKPEIHYSTDLLDFGFYSTESSFTITKSGIEGSISYNCIPSQTWITVDPVNGNVDNETDNVNVSINRDGLTENLIEETILVRTTFLNYESADTIDIIVKVHSPLIFNPDLTYGTVTDVDGNIYKTIDIGTQTWMAENLKTTHFNNSNAIPEVTSNSAWGNLKTPGFCWYDNDSSTYRYAYGALYNWYAAKADNICPTGWHVPTQDEWDALVTFIGGKTGGGIKLKETGPAHWKATGEATNEFGFTAIPGGYRQYYGTFLWIGNDASWWSSTESDANQAWNYSISREAIVDNIWVGPMQKVFGYSIRCIKDN
jgi:uncharacterized protein (TIGR02145 family)